MRVLFFNYEYPPLGGGAANATEQIFRVFKDDPVYEDIKIDLVTSALGSEHEVIRLSENITIYRVPIGKNDDNLNYQSQKELLRYTWRSLFFARTLVKKNKYDLTHSFFGIPCGAISLYFKIFARLPYIVSLRGADVPGYSERFVFVYCLFTPLIRTIWWQASHVVTNSRGLTELAQQSSTKQEFAEIFNGIDTMSFNPGKRTVEDKKRDFVILCAARLTYRKGFHDAIDAFAVLYEKFPHVRMIIAGGDGGVMRKLKGQAQALGVHKAISFPGYYTKQMAPDMYKQSDVFLMPSLNEGMSNNVLEALASGLPLLMTPTGGSAELVKDGKNGYMIAFSNGDDIAEKLEKLVTDPTLCDSMGQESLQIAEELSWSHAAEAYAELYRNV